MTTRLRLGLAVATVAAALSGCSSSNSLADSVDGRAGAPDAGAGGGCVCDDGERNTCTTLEQLCQYAHPSECDRGSTLDEVLASSSYVNWAEVGCGLRLVGQFSGENHGFAYLFDAETGELKGGAFTTDYSIRGQCPSVNSYFGDTSRFDRLSGLSCDQKIRCGPTNAVLAPCLPGAGALDAGS